MWCIPYSSRISGSIFNLVSRAERGWPENIDDRIINSIIHRRLCFPKAISLPKRLLLLISFPPFKSDSILYIIILCIIYINMCRRNANFSNDFTIWANLLKSFNLKRDLKKKKEIRWIIFISSLSMEGLSFC